MMTAEPGRVKLQASEDQGLPSNLVYSAEALLELKPQVPNAKDRARLFHRRRSYWRLMNKRIQSLPDAIWVQKACDTQSLHRTFKHIHQRQTHSGHLFCCPKMGVGWDQQLTGVDFGSRVERLARWLRWKRWRMRASSWRHGRVQARYGPPHTKSS